MLRMSQCSVSISFSFPQAYTLFCKPGQHGGRKDLSVQPLFLIFLWHIFAAKWKSCDLGETGLWWYPCGPSPRHTNVKAIFCVIKKCIKHIVHFVNYCLLSKGNYFRQAPIFCHFCPLLFIQWRTFPSKLQPGKCLIHFLSW